MAYLSFNETVNANLKPLGPKTGGSFAELGASFGADSWEIHEIGAPKSEFELWL